MLILTRKKCDLFWTDFLVSTLHTLLLNRGWIMMMTSSTKKTGNSKKRSKASGETKKNKKVPKARKKLTGVQEQALIDLRAKMTELSRKYPMRTFDVSRCKTKEDVMLLQRILNDYGMLFLRNATTEASFVSAKQNLTDSFMDMFQYDLTDEELAKVHRDDISR